MTITDTLDHHATDTPTSTTAPATRTTRSLPAEDVLEQFRVRAQKADADNTYLDEDLAVLREIGYLAAAVPAEFGGWGLTLSEFATLQRRLATYAPATALAMTMHTYWIGIAAELERFGDTSCRWLFDEALAGRIIAAGHAEAGNDAPVVMSTTTRPRRRRLSVHGPQDVRLERTGMVGHGRARHRSLRPGGARDRARIRRS